MGEKLLEARNAADAFDVLRGLADDPAIGAGAVDGERVAPRQRLPVILKALGRNHDRQRRVVIMGDGVAPVVGEPLHQAEIFGQDEVAHRLFHRRFGRRARRERGPWPRPAP